MADLEPGAQVGPFIIEGVVGRGGMGIVYRARDPRLDRVIALKVVSPHLAENAEYRERFVTEARAAAAVEHRGIIPIFEVDDADGVLYIAMRLVDGEDLAAYAVRHRPMAVEHALRLLAPVAEALDAAAKRGLVHRDVKPSNILIADPDAPSPEVLLSDFGLAKTQGSAGVTQTGQFVGSVDYVAPEQIATGDVDGRADQYALACVLYELLVGEPPFRRDQPMQTLFAQVNDPVPSVRTARPDVPESVDAALGRALAKNPDQRHGSAAAMLNAIAEAAGIAPIAHESSTALPRIAATPPVAAAPGSSAPPGTSARPSGRRWVVVGGAVALLLVIAAGAIAVTRGGDEGSAETAQPAAVAESGGETNRADDAAKRAEELAALQDAYDKQAVFLKAANEYSALYSRCNNKKVTRARTDCFLDPTVNADQVAAAESAAEAAGELPGLLDRAGLGNSGGCREAVATWAADEAAWRQARQRLFRAMRRAGNPDDLSLSELGSRAAYRYSAALANGDFVREEVNRLGVLVACAPASNWPDDVGGATERLDFISVYYASRHLEKAQAFAVSYCFATVGGSFTAGESSETSVKTCIARESDTPALRAQGKRLAKAYAELVSSQGWKTAPKTCKNAARRTVSALQGHIAWREKRADLFATNAPIDEIRSQAEQYDQLVDYSVSEDKMTNCVFPKGTRPA